MAHVQWLELWTLNLENSGSNPLKPWEDLFTLHCSSSLSSMNEHLAKDSDVYVCMNCLPTLIAAWLNACQRSRNGVWLNRSGREAKCKVLSAILMI